MATSVALGGRALLVAVSAGRTSHGLLIIHRGTGIRIWRYPLGDQHEAMHGRCRGRAIEILEIELPTPDHPADHALPTLRHPTGGTASDPLAE